MSKCYFLTVTLYSNMSFRPKDKTEELGHGCSLSAAHVQEGRKEKSPHGIQYTCYSISC